jgi:hypothetical protein
MWEKPLHFKKTDEVDEQATNADGLAGGPYPATYAMAPDGMEDVVYAPKDLSQVKSKLAFTSGAMAHAATTQPVRVFISLKLQVVAMRPSLLVKSRADRKQRNSCPTAPSSRQSRKVQTKEPHPKRCSLRLIGFLKKINGKAARITERSTPNGLHFPAIVAAACRARARLCRRSSWRGSRRPVSRTQRRGD